MKKLFMLCFFILVIVNGINTASAQTTKLPQLLIRLDDIGMNHSVNMAAEKMAKTGGDKEAKKTFDDLLHQKDIHFLLIQLYFQNNR